MSEYVSKKAVLGHILREIGITERQRDAVMTRHMKEFHGGAIRALQNLEHTIQSGAFDADESEGTWKATSEFAFRLNDQLEAENQRLRALLERLDSYIDFSEHLSPGDWGIEDVTGINSLFDEVREALSTTIEPTNAAKVKRIECPCCGCEISKKEKVGTEEWRHKYFGAEWPKVEGDGNDAWVRQAVYWQQEERRVRLKLQSAEQEIERLRRELEEAKAEAELEGQIADDANSDLNEALEENETLRRERNKLIEGLRRLYIDSMWEERETGREIRRKIYALLKEAGVMVE